jgi:5-methyltetrahydrofolate--homocysteine methyltransferase
MITLTLDADGTAPYGGSGVEAVTTLQELGAAAVGVNCSVGPDQLEATVRAMAAVAKVPIVVKPNAGLPTINDHGQAVYSMGPGDFAHHMARLVDAGARIAGGCCGTDPDYIRALRKAIS